MTVEDPADDRGPLVGGPRVGREALIGPRLVAHAFGDPQQQLAALLERLERAPQRGFHGGALGADHRLLGIDVADATAVAHDIAFAHLPEDATALRAGEP